jgi:aspartate-semialdehyde dehydrogenase
VPKSDLTIAIVGGETLLGRELREQIEERGLAAEVVLVATAGQVIAAGDEDEPLIIGELSPERLVDADAVLLAGDAESSRKALGHTPAECLLIDVSGHLEDRPEARIRSPFRATLEPARIHLVPDPAALALALVLGRVQAAQPIRHAVVQVFEPASARGQAGIHELQQQTASLLTFKPLDKKVFDAQLSFNMLPRYGGDAPLALEEVELRVERHLASLLAGAVPIPSLRVVQAPVFHGLSFSFWIEFADSADPSALVAALKSPQIDLRGPDVEPPTNVGAAAQSGVAVGLIEADRNTPRAVWMWAAADNLRLSVDAALAIIEESRT